jgi:methionyl aminopeptidase
MIEVKAPEQVDAMRAAGRVVARALAAVREHAAVGVSLLELDRVAAEAIRSDGAEPLFLDYHPSWAPSPFPGVICASVNDAVVHGIPTDRRLADGDLVSIDCGARLDGWSGDAAISFVVGEADPADTDLIDATEEALRAGIAAAVAALEPMLLAGGDSAYRKEADGWTLSTLDGSRAAHVEHTVAVTEYGPVLLTAP